VGSNFFRGLDPAGQLIGHFAGPNSFIAKEAHYDPLASSGFGKAVSPAMYNAGQAYGARNNVTSSPTPFAGLNPTLQDANAGYVQATKNAQSPGLYGSAPVGIKSPYQV
jgi:hypothetical protein